MCHCDRADAGLRWKYLQKLTVRARCECPAAAVQEWLPILAQHRHANLKHLDLKLPAEPPGPSPQFFCSLPRLGEHSQLTFLALPDFSGFYRDGAVQEAARDLALSLSTRQSL